MTTISSNNDAAALLGDTEKVTVYIYRVYFDMVVSVETEAGEELNSAVLSDSLDVDAGRDVRDAQTKVEDFVMNSGKYNVPVSEFYITGSKRLAMSEI
jgi:hypothetical protein